MSRVRTAVVGLMVALSANCAGHRHTASSPAVSTSQATIPAATTTTVPPTATAAGVVRAFVIAYLTWAPWPAPVTAHTAAVAPWVTPALATHVATQDNALPPTLRAELRQQATATVTSVVLTDVGDPSRSGFTVSAATTTVTNGGPPVAATRYLEIQAVRQADETWRVTSVTQ